MRRDGEAHSNGRALTDVAAVVVVAAVVGGALYFKLRSDRASPSDAAPAAGVADAKLDPNDVPKDPADAAAFWRRRAETGDARAQFQYGNCCEFALGVAKDISEA